MTCEHEWHRRSAQTETYAGYQRRCLSCGLVQVWRQTMRPNPDDTPALGEWRDYVDWFDLEREKMKANGPS